MKSIFRTATNLGWMSAYLYKISDRYVKYYKNFNYDFKSNGEASVLKFLSKNLDAKVIYDVGAHVGSWSSLALKHFPKAQIHSFEPVEYLYSKMTKALGGSSSFFLNNKALGSKEEEKEIHAGSSDSFQSSFVVEPYSRNWRLFSPATVKVTTGDLYSIQHNVTSIDFLKIDVEGYEGEVLKGFDNFLAQGAVRIIQFEYGTASIFANFLLKDLYAYLEGYKYKVGKLMPDGILFKEYHSRDEDFLGPNYIAVRSSDKIFDRFLSKRVVKFYY